MHYSDPSLWLSGPICHLAPLCFGFYWLSLYNRERIGLNKMRNFEFDETWTLWFYVTFTGNLSKCLVCTVHIRSPSMYRNIGWVMIKLDTLSIKKSLDWNRLCCIDDWTKQWQAKEKRHNVTKTYHVLHTACWRLTSLVTLTWQMACFFLNWMLVTILKNIFRLFYAV